MKQIPVDAAKYIAAKCGLDIVLIYGRKEGHDGGEVLVHAGNTYRNGRIAEEMASFLKEKVFGWAVDPEVNVDTPTAFDFPKAPDPQGIGAKIITEGLDRRGKKK